MALAFDVRYALTIPGGVLKLAQVIVSLLVIICVAVPEIAGSGSGFIWFTAVAALINSLLFLILYVVHLPGTILVVPWHLIEFVYCAVYTLFYFISGIIGCALSNKWANYAGNMHSAYGATAFFCFAAMLLYGVDAFLSFRQWRTSPPAGAHVVTTSTSTSYEHTTSTYPGSKY